MAVADYKKYLAENVLNERRTVTYRSLSRALRSHSTLAKQMLYDFHHSENAKKPHSVNAIYILTGTLKATKPATNGTGANGNDEDDIMPSSPYISSSMPNQDAAADQVPVSLVSLVREEDLEDAKTTFESISSIYVYSLQPTVLQDLNVLTDVGREMLVNHAQEDPLELGKQWGMIQNTNVKRRTGTRPPPPPPAPSSIVPAKRPAQSEPSQQQKKTETKEEERPEPPNPVQHQTSSLSSRSTEKAAPVKNEKGNLFSSFAKTKPKLKKEESSTPAASGAKSAEPSGPEDVVLDDASEDEAEELFPDSNKQASGETRESRKEREEKLKKMMEDDDDEDEEMLDAAETSQEPSTIDQPPPKQEDLKIEASVKGGRRRGRRQVMKKAVKKDSEGYLVTVEEPSWESFSEDEPAPPPAKRKPAVSAPKGKPRAKAGQGNIMSFFGKK
ncbi:DNA polymerase subunit Cdc27 [Aspergillus cavernicola]|uniref:DNA polymerase delta subunit 3 n=1 Tax=Aspergillus cavernicola TaxID=176166 RepID=A0ABR4IN24_9EURO